ncbi:MAG: DsrE/DsrF/DrsH-like family protein [Deltaproteobacteria bacterium]|nr:DsrE/DsrF/DrsH-like family protein [Deltaproteobacteria bacterium]
MNENDHEINEEPLAYQVLSLKDLIQEIVRCCEDRKLYESQKFGLPYAELNLLMQFNGERYLTVKGISQKLEVAKSRVTKIVNGLIEKGMVEQINDPKDARVKLISLTASGKKKAGEIDVFLRELHRQILLQLTPEERKNVISYLQVLRSAMETVKAQRTTGLNSCEPPVWAPKRGKNHYSKLITLTIIRLLGGIMTDSIAKKEDIEQQVAELKTKIESLAKESPENKLSMIVFSGDLDKILASFIIGTGAVAMGMDVVMFFTFWGTPVLRDKGKKVYGKDIMGKMFGTMLPKGPDGLKLSKMNMGGMGTAMMKSLMKKKNVASLDQMLELAAELGVRIFVCEMSMDLMGFKREEMIDYPNLTYCGVAKFLEEAQNSKIQLFM